MSLADCVLGAPNKENTPHNVNRMIKLFQYLINFLVTACLNAKD